MYHQRAVERGERGSLRGELMPAPRVASGLSLGLGTFENCSVYAVYAPCIR